MSDYQENQMCRSSYAELMEFFSASITDCDRPSLSPVLGFLANKFGAEYCVVWEERSDHKQNQGHEAGNLFVLAAWFRGEKIFALYDLDHASSLTGMAIRTRCPLHSVDIHDDPRIGKISPIFKMLDIGSMITSPIRFFDGSHGAVNLYGSCESPPFSEEDARHLADLASFLPFIFQSVRDQISVRLLQKIDQLLGRVELDSISTLASGNGGVPPTALAPICSALADVFHSLEVSVFLENPHTLPDTFWIAGTTWEGELPHKMRTKAINEGITSWVLSKEQPVRIWDWSTFHQDRSFYESVYPGLCWKDSLGIIKAACKILHLEDDARIPPLSYMAVPIFNGERISGVIRCSAGRFDDLRGPLYFDDRDMRLLELVAAQIGRAWGASLITQERVVQKETWEARTFSDLTHQLRGPMNQLNKRIKWLMDGTGPEQHRYEAIRGLTRKARRVTKSIRLLAEFGSDKNPELRLQPLEYSSLVKLLIELAEDNQLMKEPTANLLVHVDRESFDMRIINKCRVDMPLFEQAVSNLLDNACKYSYADTKVIVKGAITNTGRFALSVSNVGIRLRSREIAFCKSRGGRTGDAEAVTGEGSGIGLWLVDRIMQAHNGFLELVPTDKEGRTEVKLVFPAD